MTLQRPKPTQDSPFARHFHHQLLSFEPAQEIRFGGVSLQSDLIYLDHAAATPIDGRVLSKMLPWLTQIYGNPANRLHRMGELAEHGLAQSRQTIADALGVGFEEVIFCSSATEANNLFLRGLARNPLRKRHKIIVAATDHSSVLTTAQDLAGEGLEVVILPVDTDGQIDLDIAAANIDQSTLCVCVMDVNNETGIIQRHLNEITGLAHKHGALIHVDAVQGFARGHFHSTHIDFDTATISAAKMYAGRGAAALIIRKRSPRIRLAAQLTGGGHEFGLRSGTPNLAAIIGFAEGVRLHMAERSERTQYLAHLESIFLSSLAGRIPFSSSGTGEKVGKKVAGIVMLHIPNVNAMKLIENMKRVCVSAGSACRTLQATTSHVLTAMGYDDDVALASFRVSIGITNTEAEMHDAAEIISTTATELQNSSAHLPL